MRIKGKYLPVRVIGDSMLPTLQCGDFLLIKRIGPIEVGDLVAVQVDPASDQLLIKRVVDIEAGLYWLSGDNVKASKDSRSFGWISEQQIMGTVLIRYWPKFKLNFKVN
jgi:nickel-type superoxide dismutase maturation protease